VQRDELRDKLFEEISTSERIIQTSDTKPAETSQPWVKTYSGGKPNYTEPTIDGWPLYSGLPQTEPEPVAWTTDVEFDDETEVIPAKEKGKLGTSMNDIPLYTTQPERKWVGLTDEEMTELYVEHKSIVASYSVEEFARAIEFKLKEKNCG
jgi:hypothetical protein